MNAYQLKISVKNSKPLRWRRCIIPAGITYSQLSLLLSSLMEQSQEKPFSFEFYHAKIRFRENDGQQPFQSNFYYSLGDAAENYINELLDSQEWFSFYWGEDLALRVNIEKRLPTFLRHIPFSWPEGKVPREKMKILLLSAAVWKKSRQTGSRNFSFALAKSSTENGTNCFRN